MKKRKSTFVRREFIKTSLSAGAGLMMPAVITKMAAAHPVPPLVADPLPWQREIALKEAATTVFMEAPLHPSNPMPNYGFGSTSGSMSLNNLTMRSTIWGPAHRPTISITKNNVWDRRVNWYEPPTLKDITEGAFAPINKDYEGIQPPQTLRPKNLGWLDKEKGAIDPYRKPIRYSFPCLKPVGQIILGLDALEGAEAPQLKQSCSNGLVSFESVKGTMKAKLEYILDMEKDVYAIRGQLSGINQAAWLRLYRHRDTDYRMYMTEDGKSYTVPGAEKDKAFNGPIDPPTSHCEGNYFWLRQKMPAEKTFPKGFEYVLMGVLANPGKVQLEVQEGKKGLGTPPMKQPVRGDWYPGERPWIGDTPGAAATASFTPHNGRLEAFVTIVTTMDGADLVQIAKQRLDAVVTLGFDGVVKANTAWWDKFYDKREQGRVFQGLTGNACSDDIRGYYLYSWADSHGGGTKTDMRKLESSASYVLPEQDAQGWNSGPCYNEIFTTPRFVRNWGDSEDMWKQLVQHWLPGAREAAKTVFGMPGIFLVHGYLPPIKPDKYVHVTITLELCLGTMAQTLRPAWDEWDYGGDLHFLRQECYPLMKEMALFYAAYAKKGDDGFYHVTPSMQEESWGIYPGFSKNKDVVSSLCLFRWALNKAADAAELLDVDAALRKQWREVAAQLAPNPTWKRAEGMVFAEMPGLEPIRLPNDHYADAAAYPTLLADEIHLDSPRELKEMMIRSVKTLPSASTNPTLLLLGRAPEGPDPRRGGRNVGNDAEALLNSRSGRIHLFPAVQPGTEIAFHKFQARGGFLVSACRNKDGVYYLEITSRRDISCQLMNPWPGKKVTVRTGTKSIALKEDNSNGPCLVFPTQAGQTYIIEPNG